MKIPPTHVIQQQHRCHGNPQQAKHYRCQRIEQQLRQQLCVSLDMLGNKRQENPPKKHGNIPL